MNFQDNTALDPAFIKLRDAVEEFVADCKANDGYMPAIATLLRLLADDLADRYPDDANCGDQRWQCAYVLI